ncbi:MAG: hypothetical protein H7X77_03415 [Anaerolineae bacterium]|nr:hypothetical protein [Anaerolineae bacterium]
MLEKIKAVRFDRIYGKHEGPWGWSHWLDDDEVEFIQMSGYEVLLPINKDHYLNITPLRVIPSADTGTLTIFFKDTTFGGDRMDAGYLAICEKIPGENFFVATVYHEWFILDNPLFNTD